MAQAGTSSAEGEPLLLVGRVRKPHGIRGELFVWLETDRAEAVFVPGRVLWVGDEAADTVSAQLTVERARPFKGGVLLKPREHAMRTDALDELRGSALYIRRSDAAPLADDEVFYHDLVGLRVVAAGRDVGHVRQVYETAGADLLVVERGRGEEVLVPFVREMVRRLDLGERVLEIEPPEGLLEL